MGAHPDVTSATAHARRPADAQAEEAPGTINEIVLEAERMLETNPAMSEVADAYVKALDAHIEMMEEPCQG